MAIKYLDKNGKEIKAGMYIKHKDEDKQELVYPCGDDDLGINASNEVYLARHPDADRQFYPLYQFDLREWEVVEHD